MTDSELIAATGLRHVADHAIASELGRHAGHVLGCLGFGAPAPLREAGKTPFCHVDMPVVGAQRFYELWTSPLPVRIEARGAIRSARNEQVLFGCMDIQADDGTDYDALIYEQYCQVFDFIDEAGHPNLLRAWHYLPEIHADDRSVERYKRFSLGRHEAFVAKGRAISRDAPAASAVGKRPGNTVICFLAALRPGTPIENPRQVSAYSYPAQYGPRGPTFARAVFAKWNDVPQLYVSGTASIFGHASRHEGDAAAQADETILNLQSVMTAAREYIDSDGADLLFKAYLRQSEFRAAVEPRLRAAFGPAPEIVFLQADICRRELLLEIEVACTKRGMP